uniref:RRM domain-containing protein n=1 Tax=Heterorhabditis bacteriophora TaxID=37862 RepID=A0A1I7X782_HETBA
MDIPEQGPFKAFVGNLPFDAVQSDIECILKSLDMSDDLDYGGRRLKVDMATQRPNDRGGRGGGRGGPSERPRLMLKARSTDPAELEAKKKREEEEEARRRAKLFGHLMELSGIRF